MVHWHIEISLTVICCAVLFVPACSKPAGPQVAVKYEVDPQPPHVGTTQVTFTLADQNARIIAGAQVHVEADMTHAGMSPAFADATEISPGRYQAALHLEMAGDWVVLLHAVLPGGQKLERQFDMRDVRPN